MLFLIFINFFGYFFPINDNSEESFIEILSALFYLFSFIFCIFSIYKKRSLFIIILAILNFIFLCEETNWFQVFVDYSIPAIERLNSQNEISIHNLYIFRHGGLRGSTFNIRSLLDSQNLFRLFFFSFFLVIPYLYFRFNMFKKLLNKLGYINPKLNVIIPLIFILTINIFLTTLVQHGTNSSSTFGEIRELIYAFFLFNYSYGYFHEIRFK
ncbi:MAG: hypothetical protein JJ831_08135 [Prochlorococcus marinus XMU1422]|nr:hypothetical protein [Prochlorococcus marinus XMU1421]MBO7013269.1 hypothetical protein [Prochlorococcus marinus XMU1422]MCR8542276.1 hypothetical protein [Prochlorococcus marinus XMU1423]